MKDIIRFSVSLPENLLICLDEKIGAKNYASRSEFIRDLIREKIVKDSWSDDNTLHIGVLTIIYDHHQTDLVAKKIQTEHNANIEIFCTNHIHLDHNNCLETSVLKGLGKEISSFKDKISGLKGIKFCELTKAGITDS